MGALKLAYYTEIETAQKTWTVYKKGAPEKFYTLQKSELDYYPYGMLMPDRHTSTSVYRYGFQGQEKDDEIKGEGNSLNYKYRMHDPRLGRFFAVDPLAPKYPELTPYQFSSNSPLGSIEIEGLEGKPFNAGVSFNFSKSLFSGEKKDGYRFGATLSGGSSTIGLWNDVGINFKSDVSFSIYNSGPGTSGTSRKWQYDLTAGANFTFGRSTGVALPNYTINARTPSAIPNTFRSSYTWGAMYNINSAENKSGFFMISALRGKNWSLSMVNDEKGFPFFGFSRLNDLDAKGHRQGTDRNWTGEFTFSLNTSFGLLETGYESFTGDATRGEFFEGERNRWQSPYGQSLNKANTFFKYSNPNLPLGSLQMDWYGEGWLQIGIHKFMSDEYFRYNYRKLGLTYTNIQTITNFK